ncbi:MAG: Fibronectin type III domain protein [Firmicutes bacterium ADurb.Bin182]|nr:MAG: Fibronectin type III domain protein [Firmicutes bacterium ADurb.Bin182]
MKGKRLLSLILCAMAVLILLPAKPSQAAGIWSGEAEQPPGNGNAAYPYQISKGEHLKWFANQVNSGNTRIYGNLTVDIQLNDTQLWETWGTTGTPTNSWTPIGSEAHIFSGVFDGKGHTISGVYINSSSDYQGLFGYIMGDITNNAVITNVKLASSYIKGRSNVGGICGYVSYYSNISGCESGATVIGTGNYTGGITGCALRNTLLDSCLNTGSITGGYYTGGITGQISETVIRCVNQGVVSGSGSYIGGLAGINCKELSDSYNNGNVTVSSSEAAGGICRVNSDGGTVKNVYNSGIVTGGWPVFEITSNTSSLENVYYIGSSANNGIGSHSGMGTPVNQTAEQFASGETAYLMGETYGQSLGTDPLPVFRAQDGSNAVYKLTYINGETEHAAQYYNAGDTVSSDGITDPVMEDGDFLEWVELPSVMPAKDVTVYASSTPGPPQIATETLPQGKVYIAYSARIESTGTKPITYSIISGELPAGLTLNGDTGEITGTPPAPGGSSTFTIQARNDYGQDEKTFTIDISYDMLGSGSMNDPYQIWTADHLIQFANTVNNSTARIYGTLMADITLNENDIENWENWGTEPPDYEWTPIGSSSERSFKGGFNGNDHTISGIYIKNSDNNNQGLFGFISAATKVENLRLDKSYFEGKDYVGGICGYIASNNCSITNCRTTATVSGNSFVGGVCGYVNTRNISIKNCQNGGMVSGTERAGRIAGDSRARIENCINCGTVSGGPGGNCIGGICGISYNSILNSYNSGSVSGSLNIGGICGLLNGNKEINTIYTAELTNVYNSGSVTGTGNDAAICGATNEYCALTGCYYLDSSAVDGIGYNPSAYVTISKSCGQFASGEVAYLLGAAFGQSLGTDADPAPVFRSANNSNAVYKLTYMNEETEHAAQYYNADDTVSAEGIPLPAKEGYCFSHWESLPGTMPESDATVNAVFLPLTEVSLVSATADGSPGAATSTRIDLKFSGGISGLTADNIEIDDGTGSAVKGALTGSGTDWSIALSSVTVEGSVTVTVTAPYGYSILNNTKTIDIYRYEPPAATVPSMPQGLTAAPGDRQVTLSWSAPANDGGAEINGYEVIKDGETAWTNTGIATEHTFTGLINGQSYSFRVRAVNSEGAGAEAAVTATPQAAVPAIHTITASAGVGGKISPDGKVSVTEGGNQTFEITPDAGYIIESVTVDGTDVGAITFYTFSNVTADHTIHAIFRLTDYGKPIYFYRTLTDFATGVSVSGNIRRDATLTVKSPCLLRRGLRRMRCNPQTYDKQQLNDSDGNGYIADRRLQRPSHRHHTLGLTIQRRNGNGFALRKRHA